MRAVEAEEVDAMFCPNCGAQNPDGTPKCTTCGQMLQSAVPRPQAKFKGTMLMSTDAAPRAPAAGPPATPKAQFAKTMMGGMASIDPASIGGGIEAARTIAMDAASFGLPTMPQGSGPDAPPFAVQAPAPSFAQRPAPAPAPEPDPASSTDEEMLAMSTIAADSSSFGFDRDLVPGPGPASFGQAQAPQFQPQQPQQAPQFQPQQAPQFQPQQAPQFQPQQAPQFQPQQAPQFQAPAVSSSTVAMDASAFGLGGPGGFGQPQASMQQGPGPGGPNMFAGLPQNEPGGIASTLAVDASAFGLGGMAGPGGPGMQSQGGYGPQQGMQQQGMQQQGYPQQQGMQQQGGYGMQPGMQQQGYPQQQGGYGMQQPPAKGGTAAKVIIAVVLGLIFVGFGLLRVVLAFMH